MGAAVSSLSSLSPRWSSASFSLALLWRSQALAVLRSRAPSASEARRLLLMSVLLVSSRGRVWRWVRQATGLPYIVQRVAIMTFLQGKGRVIPLLAVLISIASELMERADQLLPPSLAGGAVPAMVSGTLMYFLHERPSAISPSYRGFLRVVSGPSKPVLAGGAAAAVAAAPLLPSLLTAAARATDVGVLLPFFAESFKHNFRSFLIFYLVIRPVFRRRKPQAISAYHAARTALWVSLAGLVGFAAGRVALPGRPGLTTAVRVAMGAAGSLLARIDPVPARRPILSFLMAQALYCDIKLAEAAFMRGSAIERAVSVLYPVFGLLDLVKASNLTAVVVKAL